MTLHLFEGFGVELEYMLVDARTLDVLPATDRVLEAVAGSMKSEVELGATAWSNELALHVIEFKTNGPAPDLAPLPALFAADVQRANALLAERGGRLMPTAMHPWMDPDADLLLWPHEYNPIYEQFNRIFDCRGHGWGNLQSVHLNLPFAGDDEFGRLHAAIRMLLPLLPALAASSPVADGRLSGHLDTRLNHYRTNCARFPSVTGHVIPEPVYNRLGYERDLLGRIYHDLAPHDPEGILRHEWVNARGAIARFDRNAIEIRVLDVQECPRADVAICAAIVAVLAALVEERWAPLEVQQVWPTEPLEQLLLAGVRDAERAWVDDAAYLEALGLPPRRCQAGEVWRHLVDATLPADSGWRPTLEHLLERGPLARRILEAVGPSPDRARLRKVYAALCECLQLDRLFP